MIDSFEIALIALATAITIDLFNMWLLVRLWKWSQTAGKSLIGQVVRSLNIKPGNNPKIKDQIQDIIGNISEPDQETGPLDMDISKINIPALITKYQSGNMDIKDFLPIAMKLLSSQGNNQKGNGGAWK